MFWRKKHPTKLAKAMIAKAKLATAKLAKAKASDNNKAYKITVWGSRSGVIFMKILCVEHHRHLKPHFNFKRVEHSKCQFQERCIPYFRRGGEKIARKEWGRYRPSLAVHTPAPR